MKEQVENHSGIYIILNTKNAKLYIGSAIKLNKRKREHIYKLKKGIHSNNHLQSSFNKHSIGCFQFFILERCEVSKLLEREQYYLDSLKPEYNMCKVAGNRLGIKLSRESRDRMAKAKKGKKVNSLQLAAIREAMSLKKGIPRPHVNNNRARRIEQFSLDGLLIKEWETILQASKELNINRSNIDHCCAGNQKTGGGFKWKYSDVK